MGRLVVLIAAVAATVVATVAGAPRAGAQNIDLETSRVPFGAGEELIYNVTYRAALIPPINIMKVSMRTLEESSAGGARQFHIVGNGRTTGGVRGLYDLNDTYHSWLDGATLLPTRMTSDVRQGDYRFTATYTYDWRAMRVSNVRRNARWESDRRATFELPSTDCGDAMSLLYRMRTIDAGALIPGGEGGLSLVLSEDAKPIVYRFIGRENIKIRKVGTFRALKFTCTMATSDGSTYQEGMSLTAWISDDGNKIPLMVESPVRVGRVTVTIAPDFRTVHPMTSRVK